MRPGKIKIKITVTRVYDAEFTDTRAASLMFKELERDPNPTIIESRSDVGDHGRWSICACAGTKTVSVESLAVETARLAAEDVA